MIVVSSQDIAGMSMKEHLLTMANFEEKKFVPPKEWPAGSYELRAYGSIGMLTVPTSPIQTDFLGNSIQGNLVIFASKHQSKAGMKAILVHPTGNWQDAWNGSGQNRTLAIASGQALYLGYHALKNQLLKLGLTEYWVGMECTHHGPTKLDVPVMFMECGGTEEEWKDQTATKAVANGIFEVAQTFVDPPEEKLDTAIGVGGGHYCPAFIKRVDRSMFYIGHVVPKHHHEALDERMIVQAWNKTLGRSKFFLIDKKGTKGEARANLIEIFEKLGYRWHTTSEFPTK